MENIEFQWLHDEGSLKEALQTTLGSSGQQLKKYFSSKQLNHPIRSRDLHRLPINLVNHLMINPIYQGPEIKILKETPQLLALHKPSLIHSHPHSYSDKDTLLNFLAAKNIWEPLCVNNEHYDRGLLYRLDFETSGIMLMAKTDKLLASVRKEFDTQIKRKFYWAIVNGDFNQEGVWTHHFRASGIKGSKQKVFTEPGAEQIPGSLSVLKVLEHEGKSLVLVNLKTGLRHQIRAQLAALGFPIVGDELYGGGHGPRLFLHALRYEWFDIFEDPEADLFDRFFDLDRALKMTHDMIGRF